TSLRGNAERIPPMGPKRISASFLLLALLTFVGCALNRTSDLRKDGLFARIGGGGQVIEPKRSLLTVIHLTKPLKDEIVNTAIWRTADEQAVPPETRRAWQVNGLRIGLISGELPAEIDAVLKAPPPNRIDPAQLLLADGDSSLV